MQVNICVGLFIALIVSTVPGGILANIGHSLIDNKDRSADAINVMITDQRYMENGGLQYGTEDQEFTGQRRKRSALGLLAQKMKLLLKDTFQIPSKTSNVREFEKMGTLKTALKDFKDTNPAFVRKIKYPNGGTGRYGYIGDKTIVLKARGDYGRPSIEVIKRHRTVEQIDPLIDRITYIKEIKY